MYINIRCLVIILTLAVSLSACNLGNTGQQPTAETLDTPTPEGKPEVEILSPQSGDEFVVDDEILVSVQASDSIGVTRVQLLANNQIVKTVSSESLTGDKSFSALLDYTPRSIGSVFLRVVAYRGAEVSDPAEIEINIRAFEAQVTATSNQASNIPVIPNDGVCRALINVGLNFRSGPGTNFDRISVLTAGTLAPIVGRIGDNTWWQLIVNNRTGWVSSEFTTEYGNCLSIPLVATPTPQVTTTSTPTSTNAAPPTSTTAQQSGEPDLVVADIQGDRSIIVPSGVENATETYKVKIRNTGGSGTGQFSTSLQVGDTIYDLGVVADLGAGLEREFSVNVTFDEGGTYALRAFVDSDEDVSEISEINNRGEVSVTVAFE